ncbi:uncharacterized protein M6B38_232625 [Iris pallida]|uniref:Uncharacterized protein n=1 Tax=Iris pallida TaxID=29817 RepID=A0AAX6DS04_IRIPA|nr:uncharacterized protein M6B38_232625 [Iris pallida]
MGNYISCTLSIPSSVGGVGAGAAHHHSIKVVLPSGEVLSRGGRHTAAELMLDFPGHFLANSRSLHPARRFSALSADEDLEPGNVYVMFPMQRLSSVVCAADVGRLLLAAGKAARMARVSPAAAPPPPEPAPEEEEVMERRWKLDEELVAEVRARLSLSRSRKPTLQTIAEENTVSAR